MSFVLSWTTTAQVVREANTTLNFPAAITTSSGYELAELFPNLTFEQPVCISSPPGETNRLFVVERAGRIIVINDLNNPTKETFLDIRAKVHAADWITSRRTEGLSSIAFHPQFATNHRFFVTYNTVTQTSQGDGHHNRVAEFRANDENNSALPESEIALITQFDEGDGHNINDLHFGPDGYLYIATGDEGDAGTGDDFHNSQKITKDFFSALMRIDVDRKTQNLAPNAHPASNASAYKIPADNPYVGARSFNGMPVDPTKVRTEFFSVGLRNPWRFSFDPLTGRIFEGDVGQHGREEINQIVKGGNYGWSYKEGTAEGVYGAPEGFTSIPPVWEYGTNTPGMTGNTFSVTGGVVYRGADAELNGQYFFSDYVTGHIWSMNVDSEPAGAPVARFAEAGIASFGYDPRNGDVLAVNHDQGKIKRVKRNSTANNLPLTLTQTGIFSDLATLKPNAGIYDYDVNVPLWSDGAGKRRWFSIPDVSRKMTFSEEGNWSFPAGSVWVKHFEIETTPGDAASTLRLETRVLVKTTNSVYGVTYKWNEAGTEATLVEEEGDSRSYTMGSAAQTWRYPSRSECLSCHTEAAGRILGFTTAQMNRPSGGENAANQLQVLKSAGFFEENSFPSETNAFRKLAPPGDTSSSLTHRAKSYLAANCAHCHQPGTSAHAAWDGRASTPLSDANIVLGRVVNASDTTNKVVTPGNVARSAIISRMESTGANQMPPVGVHVKDAEAIAMLKEWINSLEGYETYEAWAARLLQGSPSSRSEDADGDGISNFTEYLAGSDPKSRSSLVTASKSGDEMTLSFQQPANRAFLIDQSSAVPGQNWTMLSNAQNHMTFPAQNTPRTFTQMIDTNAPLQTFRLRIFEP